MPSSLQIRTVNIECSRSLRKAVTIRMTYHPLSLTHLLCLSLRRSSPPSLLPPDTSWILSQLPSFSQRCFPRDSGPKTQIPQSDSFIFDRAISISVILLLILVPISNEFRLCRNGGLSTMSLSFKPVKYLFRIHVDHALPTVSHFTPSSLPSVFSFLPYHPSPPCSFPALMFLLLLFLPPFPRCSLSSLLPFLVAPFPRCSLSSLLPFLVAPFPRCSLSSLLPFLVAPFPRCLTVADTRASRSTLPFGHFSRF